ncbi:MAG: metallophosphoesterase family protein [Acidobacteriota bacterium]
MRVAALYDIHGNLPALEAVLAEVERIGVDLVVIGGDVVPGPMPRETLDALLNLELPVEFIHGNGERELSSLMTGGGLGGVPEAYHEAFRWIADVLTAEQRAVLAGWPPTVRFDIPHLGSALFCHATPRSDTELFTSATPERDLLAVFGAQTDPLVVCGHTHIAFDRRVGRTRVVNAGSVGMPFGTPGAHWLLLGPDVELKCTDYDREAACARIRASGYPQAEEFATRYVLDPPSEREMQERFEQARARVPD